MKSVPHVAIYTRVSTADQVDAGMSLDAQPALVHKRLTKEFGDGGYTYEEFCDEGVSGGKGPLPWASERKAGERKGLWTMLQALKSGAFTHLAAFRLDRLYRDKLGQLGLYGEIMKPNGVKYVLVADTFDDSLTGQLTHGILAEIAEYQRLQISDNITKTLDYRRSQGYYLGTIPFGWRSEKEEEKKGERRNIVPVPEERGVVIRIKDMYLSGLSMEAIAITLNREMIPHKRSEGKWQGATVSLVLANPTHAGLTRLDKVGGLGVGAHFDDRFYDESDFRRILDRVERNRKRLKGVSHSQPFRLFTGIAFCGHCDRKLMGSFHTDTPAYRCLGRRSSGDGSHVYINANQLEQLIVQELARISAEPATRSLAEVEIEKIVASQDEHLATEAKNIRKTLSGLEEQQEALIEAVANKTFPHGAARKRFDKITSESKILHARLLEIDRQLDQTFARADLVRAATTKLKDFSLLWRTMNDSERRETLHTVIEQINVFVCDGRKWMTVKLATDEKPIDIEILRGAERYRPKVLDGVASLTPRELAALKHALDGANYKQIAKYFDTWPSSPYSLLARAKEKLGASTVQEAAQMAEFMIRRMGDQLPLFGKAKGQKYAPKRLQMMEYQVLDLSASDMTTAEIALRTGLHVERVAELLQRGLGKCGTNTAKAAMKRVLSGGDILPATMVNRSRIG